MSTGTGIDAEVARQLAIIKANAVEIIPETELPGRIRYSLEHNRPLRIKQGIDPTAPDVHIGHMVPFGKMRQCQDLGHTGVIIIGDYTASIGDPSGRNKERPHLSPAAVKENAEKYTEQIFKVVDRNRTEVHFQSKWFSGFDLQQTIKTMAHFSLAQMLAHETFRRRMEEGARLSLHELLYPVLQAWDSVEVQADIELGGTDQKFNMLCGRDLMRENNMPPQLVLCMPLIPGTDGRKMSKSFGNYIPVLCPPADMYGKLMSIADSMILDYFRYVAPADPAELKIFEEQLAGGQANPRHIKAELARRVVAQYHSNAAAAQAARAFDQVFTDKKMPDEMPEYAVTCEGIWICRLMKEANITSSTSEAVRLIKQGAVALDDVKITDSNYQVVLQAAQVRILKTGKRRFLKVVGI